jgi:hypothetical protein
VKGIAAEQPEHRIAIIKRIEEFLKFDDGQMEELRNAVLFKEDSNPREFMKTYRKMAGVRIISWTQMVETLREAARRWSVFEVQKLTRDSSFSTTAWNCGDG